MPIQNFPSFFSTHGNELFDPDPDEPHQISFILNELDQNLAFKAEKPWSNDPDLYRLLLILTEAMKIEKYVKSFNSLEHLTKLLRITDDLACIALLLENLFIIVSIEGFDYKENKLYLLQLAFMGRYFFMNINSHAPNSKAKLYDFFHSDENFKKLLTNLKEYEREVYDIDENHKEFIFEYSFPNKETLTYEDLLKINIKPEFMKQEAKSFKTVIYEEKPCFLIIDEFISQHNLMIKPNTPLYDAMLIRLKFDRYLRNPACRLKILDVILKSSCLNSKNYTYIYINKYTYIIKSHTFFIKSIFLL